MVIKMKRIAVSKTGKIKTINEALSMIKLNEEAIIEIDKGIFNEKILIDNPNITIRGKGIDKTIITYNDYSKKIHKDNRDYNTFRTATMNIIANGCKITDLTIENSTTDLSKGQSVALSVYGNKTVIENCKIKSLHDTLFLGPLPDDLKERYTNFLSIKELFIEGSIYSRFTNCIIEGSIDFIFGTGSSLFENCSIISKGKGYVVAPAHSMFQKTGFVFKNCHFINETNEENSVYLLRFWRPYGITHFIDCEYDNHIIEEGIIGWNNKNPQVFSRVYEYPSSSNRADWMNTLSNYEYQKLLDNIKKEFNF